MFKFFGESSKGLFEVRIFLGGSMVCLPKGRVFRGFFYISRAFGDTDGKTKVGSSQKKRLFSYQTPRSLRVLGSRGRVLLRKNP